MRSLLTIALLTATLFSGVCLLALVGGVALGLIQ